MNLWVDILLTALGVAVAPFLIQGIRRSQSRTGRIIQALLGVGLLLFFLAIWGQFGRDPLQIAYCAINKRAPTCPGPAPETLIGGHWRLEQETACDRRIIRHGRTVSVRIEGVLFTEQIERIDEGGVVVVVTAPDAVASQRFRLTPTRDGDRLTVVPLLGGDVEVWRRCEP